MSVQPDEAYALLGVPRRRLVLVDLADGASSTIEELSARIAAVENEVAATDEPAVGRREVRLALIHNHLPYLADHGVVEYDVEDGTVVRSGRFDELRPLIDGTTSRVGDSSAMPVR